MHVKETATLCKVHNIQGKKWVWQSGDIKIQPQPNIAYIYTQSNKTNVYIYLYIIIIK